MSHDLYPFLKAGLLSHESRATSDIWPMSHDLSKSCNMMIKHVPNRGQPDAHPNLPLSKTFPSHDSYDVCVCVSCPRAPRLKQAPNFLKFGIGLASLDKTTSHFLDVICRIFGSCQGGDLIKQQLDKTTF